MTRQKPERAEHMPEVINDFAEFQHKVFDMLDEYPRLKDLLSPEMRAQVDEGTVSCDAALQGVTDQIIRILLEPVY